MVRFNLSWRTGSGLLSCALAGVASAAESSVPYVPTPQDVVERMLDVAQVGARDYLVDLGSGDGRIVVTAAKKYGTRGFGVDLNPDRIRESNENARAARVADKVSFSQRNLFETDLSGATVITMYLLPRVNMQLRPALLALKPGTRIVSHDFSMEDWKPDREIRVESPAKWGGSGGTSEIYFWVVPARVTGAWQFALTIRGKPVAYRFSLDQKFQAVSGVVSVGGRRVSVQGAQLTGDALHLAFTAEVDGDTVRHEFSGRVDGDAIVGSVALSGARIQGRQEWNARRAGPAASAAAEGGRRATAVHRRVAG